MYNNQFILGLQTQRVALIEQIHHIDAMLKLNGISVDDFDPSLNGDSAKSEIPYKKGDSWQVKFGALIKSANRYISINEGSVMINSFEPKISIDEAKKGLGSAKNALLKAGAISKVQIGPNNSNTFYGSPSWLNTDGTIKEQHKYNEDALIVKPRVVI